MVKPFPVQMAQNITTETRFWKAAVQNEQPQLSLFPMCYEQQNYLRLLPIFTCFFLFGKKKKKKKN